MSIDYFIATSSVLETSPLPYADLQLVNVRRYCVPYDQLKFMNQRLSASAICEKVGLSKHTMSRFRHSLHAPKLIRRKPLKKSKRRT